MTVDTSDQEILVQATHEGIQLVGLGGFRVDEKQVHRIPWKALGIEHVRFADYGELLPDVDEVLADWLDSIPSPREDNE